MNGAELLKKFALLAELAQADCDELLEILEPETVHAGRTLFREGQESDGLALLLEGSIRLERSGAPGPAVVDEGVALGAMSLVGLGKREVTATTETACRILWLRRSEFRRLTEDAPRTACRLLEAIAGEFAGRMRAEIESVKS